MLRKKNITLNGKKAEGSEKLEVNDEIKMFLSDETINNFSELTVTKVEHNLDIIYEDKNIMVINKPAGMLSQKAESKDISLVEYVISYLLDTKQIVEEELQSFKPSICNRLDRNTSGIIVAGKTLIGLQTMAEIFKDRSIHKYYYSIVKGQLTKKSLIEGYLKKDEKTNKVVITDYECEGADYIKTEYEPVKIGNQYTLVSVKLITGRTHQIRAHLQSIGHPIIGDFKYGNPSTNDYFKKNYNLKHQLLHSYRIIFPELKGELKNLSGKEVTAKLPDYFEKICKDLF
jgi:23S rRNA pseudouridine955/2504/2580 synthase